MLALPKFTRMRLGRYGEWARAVLMTGSMQVGVQLLAFVSGIVILRQLSPGEYAFYTIANTVVGAMNVVADSGLSSAALALGGEKWQDRNALGRVLTTSMAFRWRLGLLTMATCLPALCVLLFRQGASWTYAAMVAIAVVPSFLLGLASQLLDVVPRLHQNLFRLQSIQVQSNAARAIVVAIGIFVWPFAAMACLLAAVPLIWMNRRLRALASIHADLGALPDATVESRLRVQVFRKMPDGIYFAISGPLTIWLVTLFGSTSAVATVGALTRLAVAFTILGTVFNAVAIPRFARIAASDGRTVICRFWQSQLLLLGASTIPLLALWIEPHAILSILGPSYSGYVTEALLMALSGLVGVLISATHGLGAARGVILPPLLSIPYTLLGQVTLILLLPVGTVSGVILLGLLSGLSSWLLLLAYVGWRISR